MPLFNSMRRATRVARFTAGLAVALILTAGSASAQTPTLMSGYNFQYLTNGSLSNMSGATTLINAGVDDASSSVQTLPFTFNFGGNNYTQYSVSSNGLLGFGSNTVSSTTTASMSTSPYPWVSPKANDMITQNSGVVAKTFGTAPNRIFVVQWDVYRYATSSYTASFEVRLYETTNEVQFVYGPSASGVTSWTGKIGLVASSSNYLQVNSNTNTTSTSDVTSNTTMPAQGTVYRFFACAANVSIAGNTSQGAQTATMGNGETIFAGTSVQRGNTASFTPFTITNPTAACGTRNFTYSITGTAAADYQITPTSGTLTAGASNTPTVTFTPRDTGVRTATLTVTDDGVPAFARTYVLSASGTPRFIITGNIAQGGTAGMNSGDTLMAAIIVPKGTCQDFTPYSISNTNSNPSATALTYSIVIDSAGFPSTQYTVTTGASGTIAGGSTITPTVRFCPAAVVTGPTSARMTITTSDGDRRVYTLRAISGAPSAQFTVNGAVYLPGDQPVFKNVSTCAGEQAWSIPVTITNIGIGALVVREFAVYQTDTTYQQGTPTLPLVRDAQGRLVRLTSYVLSTQPGIAPVSSNPPAPLPVTILGGQSVTYYLTYVGAQPGKVFGRAYIRTNAENIVGTDTNYYNGTTIMPTITPGLMTMDFVASSVGSKLAADALGARLRPLIFPAVRVGDTLDRSFTVSNTGACDLRISRTALRFFSGDVNEFKLVRVLAGARVDAVTGDYVLTPGQSDSIVVRFIPSRSGTRMATLRFKTNDSTLVMPGLVERGTLNLDVQGRGKAGLDARDLVLDPVVIGSSTSGVAVLENSSTTAVEIASISFIGGEAAEFSEDNARAWPVRPFAVLPGAQLRLGVRLTPTGSAGLRRTQMLLVTNGGDSIRLNIRGEAGTQELVVSPTSLFDDVQIPVGATVRRTVMISNTGTLPIRLTPPAISGPDAANYRLGLMPRLDLEPGATEYLEVTFAPSGQGQSSAVLTIAQVGGTPQTVTLGGAAVRIRQPDRDPAGTALGNRSDLGIGEAGEAESTSGVTGELSAGMSLSAAAPNPASASATIAYTVGSRADVTLGLFDAAGRLVRTVATGMHEAGSHRVVVDCSVLQAGVYHVRMTSGSGTLSRSLVVVH